MTSYLTVFDEQQWSNFIARSINSDIYHSWQYHQIDRTGQPVLFVYQEDTFFIALPFIKRDIEGSPWYDLTSVYGYAGPVSDKRFEDISVQSMISFRKLFLEFAREQKCVSVFSRLHPFSRQNLLLEKIGGVTGNGKTIYIDLNLSLEEQRGRYEKRLSRQIRNQRKKGYLIRESTDIDDIRAFTAMYTENMRRVAANRNYFFNEDYFIEILLNPKLSSKLLLVYDGDKMACGAVVFYSDSIIRNHLSATSEAYLKESPSKLLTDEISVLGRQLGLKYFHLGGGVGGREDSLFKFKSYFSGTWMNDYTWRFVPDPASYNLLLEMRGINKSTSSQFFPLYRDYSLETVK